MQTLAGPGPACMAADGDAVWHADYWAPAIIKSDLKGALLDWGEKPFNVRGLAHNGTNLWALDNDNKRICMVEKTPDGQAGVDQERRRLDNVPSFAGRCGKQCSHVASLESVLRYHGEEYNHVDLMGLSGLAFRLSWVRSPANP